MNSTSYNVGGGAVGGAHAMAVSTNSTRRTASSRKSQQKKTPKKHVNYNPREIRSALMRATKSQSAGQVLCQARSKLANLAKCKGTGMYNESELSSAIIHAKRMVSCAKMKTKNLKQEEQQQRKHSKRAEAEEKKKRIEIKRRISQKERNLEQKLDMEKSQLEQKKQARIQELIRRRRQNRNMERSKMNEADKEYQTNISRAASGEAPILLSRAAYSPGEGVEVALSDTGLELTEAQLEQQAEMMVSAELASMGAVAVDMGGSMASPVPSPGVAAEAAGAVIDIAVGG